MPNLEKIFWDRYELVVPLAGKPNLLATQL